ncbi:MAG TPA: RNA 2',3'-cyclic phosphodiesterase [Rubricoccaceae bacterium]|jgi:2'-5' RNA ligase
MERTFDSVFHSSRFFLAIAVTDTARRAIEAHLGREQLPGRTVAPEDWHLTLRFLGETSPEALETLHEALGTADLGCPFEVAFGHFGAFPAPERAGVLWLGLGEGIAALTALAVRVEEVARQAGFPPERRPYTPHVTLSRLRPPVDARPIIDRMTIVKERMPVGAVTLFRSGAGGGPNRYEAVERYTLDGSA